MSASTMPTWWADRRPPTVSTPLPRPVRPALRRLRGLAVVLAVLGVSAVGVALPMSSSHTPIAQRTLAAERIQNLAEAWQDNHPAQPVFQPQLDRMLPITDRADNGVCAPTTRAGSLSSC